MENEAVCRWWWHAIVSLVAIIIAPHQCTPVRTTLRLWKYVRDIKDRRNKKELRQRSLAIEA